MMNLFLMVACSGTPDADGPTTQPDTDVAEEPLVIPPEDELYGTYPIDALSLPEFNATSQYGAARSREDLLGQPTVMWFFPAAGTAG